jgi:hypothetical protein
MNKTKNLIEYWTKISSQGIESLTKLEKSYLDEYEIGTEYDGTYDDSGFGRIDYEGNYTEANKEKIIYSKYLKIKNNYHMVQLVL